MYRERYCTTSGITGGGGISIDGDVSVSSGKNDSFFYLMGKELSGKLSCISSGLVKSLK